MVYPVVGWGEHDFVQEPQTAVFQQIFTNMNKGTIGTVNEHDQKQELWVYPGHNAHGGSYSVGVGRL